METELKQRKSNNKTKQNEKVKNKKENLIENSTEIENDIKRLQPVIDDEPVKEISVTNEVESTMKNGDAIQKIANNTQLEDSLALPSLKISVEYDLITILLFIVALATRTYKLWSPNNVVFDEMHYGKYVSLYMKKVFFFDQHPPLGKQLIAAFAFLSGYDGNYNFTKIGMEYTPNVPVVSLRLIPAICGSLLVPVVYKLLIQMKLNRALALLGGLLIILDNALLSQSRLVLMEPILLLFSTLGILFLLQFLTARVFSPSWWLKGILSAGLLTAALSVKYVGFYTLVLAFILIFRHLWQLLENKGLSDFHLTLRALAVFIVFASTASVLYVGIFYIHLNVLQNAGPHDAVMTSAFQASLNGGLSSITMGQPIKVVHGSQITLRHTHGRHCWLHSHGLLYPVRYADGRGSSHQQQVTCYSFKDVNNWWIVKKPSISNLVVSDPPEPIKDGDEIQLVHGITSRALNSHDVAAPVSPHSQEISCYIDYNVSMPAQIIWKVDIINKEREGQEWHAITSQVRLIHVGSGHTLKFSGKMLPDWGYHQHEVVADKVVVQQDNIWNVEEHRWTKTADAKERELQMLKAEMIPLTPTKLSFYEKFSELQMKMLYYAEKAGNTHMYSSEPLEWPLMSKGIAYWVAKDSNAQIHLLGNILIWYSGTLSIAVYCGLLVFYLVRRHRNFYDLPAPEWERFSAAGDVFFIGYFIHFLPYFFVDRTLFLHNYLPALVFKILLLCFVIDHIYYLILRKFENPYWKLVFELILFFWFLSVIYVYTKFSVLSYGTTKLDATDIVQLRWKDTWDFILHKDLS